MRIIPAGPSGGTPEPAEPAAPGPAGGGGTTAAAAAHGAAQANRWPGSELLEVPETAQALLAAWSGDPLVIVPSPPGAGKTRLVVMLAAALAERAGMRVGVAAQTRAQAEQIARRTGTLTGRAVLMWPRGQPLPDAGRIPVVAGQQAGFPGGGGGILIGTTARWQLCDPRQHFCDLMLVDEAWQATYADIGALGAFARQILCVGDPGQIDPVVTGAVSRWENDPRGPQVPAPDALATAHPGAVTLIRLRDTWRLGPATTRLIQPVFYPDMPFGSRRPDEHVAGPGGPLPEIAHRIVRVTRGYSDPALARACAARAGELLAGHHVVTPDGTRPLTAADIAVVTAHVSQASAVRALLAGTGVAAGTANQLQGQEYPAVIALHPLAGYRDAGTEFATQPGRACVALSRHRSHLTVIIDPRAAGVPGAERTLLGRLMDEPEL
jgi:hypothetical protein